MPKLMCMTRLSSLNLDMPVIIEPMRAFPHIRDLVSDVTADAPYTWSEGGWELSRGYVAPPPARFKVVAYDCGIKFNILRQLRTIGCDVTVVPASTTTAEVLAAKPDGVFISNGPGDPEGVPYLIESVRGLLGRVPIFGICLGHQILGLAAGGRTYKLPFGHHCANHPVKDLATVKVEIMGDEVTYTIVGSAEADPANGKLSMASPVGSALLGATAGQDVDVRTPRGSVTYKVLSID